MDDLVSRSALIKSLEPYGLSNGSSLGIHSGKVDIALQAIEKAPTVDAVEAIKSTEEIEQALSILNIYRNSYYAEPSGTVKYAVANAINTILPLFVKCLERRSE